MNLECHAVKHSYDHISLETVNGPASTIDFVAPWKGLKGVGCDKARLASTTKLPMKPVAPIIRTRTLVVGMAAIEFG
ncbi:hypothetical protein RJT34_24623 [Clitoria ternatea]|uniref:Uncharacterized protein n=1 Tax=Clitoria ternatea TaxID=43366 RepID=A0AAN9FUH2_CLITE